jgi:hypothetical protein
MKLNAERIPRASYDRWSDKVQAKCLVNFPDRCPASPAHSGRFPCPRCGSKNTGSTCYATSTYWQWFGCFDCKHTFRKRSANVSGIAATLAGFLNGEAAS